MQCRACKKKELIKFIDLGFAPLSNSYLKKTQVNQSENFYPLKIYVCKKCFFCQTEDFVKRNDFFNKDYAYFSKYSKTYVDHCKKYTKNIIRKLKLNFSTDKIYEIASNDGTLLINFKEKKFDCIGVEPTKSTASEAKKKGIRTIETFFGSKTALKLSKKFGYAKLIAANNVLAHVPNINDFVKGFYNLLKNDGVATFEFPHILNLLRYNQFDTIYHEHYSYLSVIALKKIFEKNKLRIFNVEKLTNIHGGSLRLYVCKNKAKIRNNKSVVKLIKEEKKFGLTSLNSYQKFQNRIDKLGLNFVKYLVCEKLKGKKISGYGAAAKANTFLNYFKIDNKLIDCIFDQNPKKFNKFMPGSKIPILNTSKILEENPDIIIIFVWNLKNEIKKLLKKFKKIQLVVVIPALKKIQ